METPSKQIFDEMKAAAIAVWSENYSDEFGYVTEKTDRINGITNIQDNAMVFFRMFDWTNQSKMMYKLGPEAINYINENR
jgi:hypothetical protein